MHLPPFFLEIAALIFALAGAACAWFTRWNVLLAAVAGSFVVFASLGISEMLHDNTAHLASADGPLAFYALLGLWGMVPGLIGAGLVRLFKRWRNR